MLTPEYYQFARQAGCTHVVIHLVDYFNQGRQRTASADQPIGDAQGWGHAGDPHALWTLNDLLAIKREVQDAGLEIAAIENLDPAHWYDVLLDGPQKQTQLEQLKCLIRNIGAAGIPILGYNFSLAGVCSRVTGPFARGQAISVGMDGVDDTPVPKGRVWNMIYDPEAPPGYQAPVTHEQLWERLACFLEALVPVAEEAGVTLAAHPDDPPMPIVQQTPRLVYQPHLYQRILDLYPSPANALEFCLGSLAEMTEGDLYESVEQYAGQGKVAYVHFRNVRGKVPHYREVFIDEGDIDMIRVLRILKKHHFDGVLIPDHTPRMTCAAPWHAGMAYALGYMKAALQILDVT